MALKIGITENSDPSHDKTWIRKLKNIDGLILVTKGLAHPGMAKEAFTAHYTVPTILHCTCTGWGGTAMEPGVPEVGETMKALEDLILDGFPAKNVVLRIDPIIPTGDGLVCVDKVLRLLTELNDNISHTGQQVTRVRVSIMDNYKHVMKRFQEAGYEPLYGRKFQADFPEIRKVIAVLKMYPEFAYSGCAETNLAKMSEGMVKPQGCISKEDLEMMGFSGELFYENPQNRSGCHCLSCKTEVLQKNHTCPHGCLYCYWKRPGE